MAKPLRIALTKGRLEKDTVGLLERLGYDCTAVREKGRRLILPIPDGNMEVVLAKANDVITYVEHGVCDMGVVGKDTIIEMLAGEKARINTGTFSNDMTTFATKDDVLTLLVHLGYLTYDNEKETVEIPNREVSQEYVNAISTMDWTEVIQSINASRKLLEALWDMDSEKVANGIEQAHKEISILEYNDENSLSCAVNLAFYFAREYYTIIREMPGGRGFADICMIPRKIHLDKPAVMIELKWDKSAEGAIQQIKNKEYIDALKDYQGDLLLAGINYDKKTKKHSCIIEKWNL